MTLPTKVFFHVMDKITAELVRELEINIDEQRLDSTHVFSNTACFGRTRLMGVTVKHFNCRSNRINSSCRW